MTSAKVRARLLLTRYPIAPERRVTQAQLVRAQLAEARRIVHDLDDQLAVWRTLARGLEAWLHTQAHDAAPPAMEVP